MKRHHVDVVIVGSGPAGLSAASLLKRSGVDRVVVLERETVAGGVPRHCQHASFGLRQFGRLMTGPTFAKRTLAKADAASVSIETETTVSEIIHHPLPCVMSTSPRGLERWEASAVILATGSRERPRSARLIPGSRASGIFTTGELQQFTYLRRVRVGSKAIVVGAEHISFSAVMTLRDAGIEPVAVVTPFVSHQSFPALSALATRFGRVPVLTEHRIVDVEGSSRVTSVSVEDSQGRLVKVACDTVVVSGDWVAEGSLALETGLSEDTRNGGPVATDADGGTQQTGVFAAGGVVHPGESASRAVISGRTAAKAVINHLKGESGDPARFRLSTSEPVRWATPMHVDPVRAGQIRFRVDRWLERPLVTLESGDTALKSARPRRLIPGRSYTLRSMNMNGLSGSKSDLYLSIRSQA